MKFVKINIILFLVIAANNLFAQSIEDFLKQDNTELYYGIVYKPQKYIAVGHPFFKEDKFYNSTLGFDGKIYSNIRIKYDLLNQFFILYQDTYENHPRFLKLNNNLIDSIIIYDINTEYFFKSLNKYSLPSDMKFFEILYEGNLSFVTGRRKYIQEYAVHGRKHRINELKRYYIIRDDKVHLILTKRDVLSLLIDKKDEVKKYIRKERLKIKLKKPNDIIKLLSFYESISNL